jgi:predicted cupin superfamily sugar epimerase
LRSREVHLRGISGKLFILNLWFDKLTTFGTGSGDWIPAFAGMTITETVRPEPVEGRLDSRLRGNDTKKRRAMTAQDLIDRYRLEPLMGEGGYYFESYRASESIPAGALPDRYPGARSFCTAIYYLLTPDTVSTLHRITSDEIFHFYLGGPVLMLRLFPDGSSDTLTIGPDIERGQRLQVVVPRGVWQGAFLEPGGDWALMGVTVAPGFEFADYEQGDIEKLVKGWPEREEMIGRIKKLM